MKQLKYFLLVFVSFLSLNALGQGSSLIVSGNVYSDVEGKLISVQVVEVDKTGRILSATATDMNGNFSLRIKSPENQLRFSYIGYVTRTFPINATRQFNVKMQDNTQMKEVIVSAKKTVTDGTLAVPVREISGAIQKINTKEFEGLSVASIDDALQGRIAGLDIVGNSGDVGAGMSLKIRGTTSINANTQPLIVLNDVPYESEIAASFDFATATEEQYANLLNINPDDIEDLTVLKDGASAAIWGSKGANGVICIKTKRGAKGPTRIQFSHRFSGATQPAGLKMLNGDDYTMLMKQAYFNPRLDEAAADIPEFNYDPSFSEYENFNNNTDWVEAVTKYGFTNESNLNITGGGDKATFRVSIGYFNQTGTVIGQGLQRYSTRMNLDYQVSDRLKFISEFSLTFSDNDKNYVDDDNKSSILDIAYKKMPNVSIFAQDANGNNTSTYYNILQNSSVNDAQKNLMNPVALASLALFNQKNIRIIPTLKLQYDLMDPDISKLRFNSYVSIDVDNTIDQKFLPKEVSSKSWSDELVNRAYNKDAEGVSVQTDNNLVWEPRLGRAHSLMLYGAWQARIANTYYQLTEKYGLLPGITDETTAGFVKNIDNSHGQGRSMAVMGRAHYACKGKYILDGTLRRDGSSRFGENRRWGTFPALSGKWIMSDESFMKPTEKWLNELGWRLGWGVTGNQPDYEYLHYSRYAEGGNYIDISTIYPSSVKLSNLQWEQSSSINFGSDMRLFNDKCVLNVDVYHRRTENLLFKDQKIPTTTGFSELSYLNIGTMDNNGWELNFSTNKLIKYKDFTFDVSLNLSNYVNKIIDLLPSVMDTYNSDFSYENGTYLTRIQEGNSYGSIYGFKCLGVYQYSDYVKESGRDAVGVCPVVHDAEGNVVFDSDGEAVPMHFAYGSSVDYEFTGGDAVYEDINHDGTIDELDIVYLGNCNPKINGGFGVTLRWKGFSMNTFSTFRYGNKIVNKARMNAENMFSNDNQSIAVNWRWRKEGDVTSVPRALYDYGYNWLGSDRFVEDGSYLRIKYITLTYNVPAKSIKRYKLNQLNLYLTLNNVATFTKYTGVDPEISNNSLGITADENKTPRSKYFTFGVTAGF